MRFILALFMVCLCSLAHAELKYEQTLTFSNFVSFEECKKDVGAFALAAKGNPDILILKADYDKVGEEPCIMYSATITCYVAEVDATFEKIEGKAFQIRHKLVIDEIEEHIE